MGSPTPPSWLMDCMIDDTMFGKFKYENCGNCGLVSWWFWRSRSTEHNWYSKSLTRCRGPPGPTSNCVVRPAQGLMGKYWPLRWAWYKLMLNLKVLLPLQTTQTIFMTTIKSKGKFKAIIWHFSFAFSLRVYKIWSFTLNLNVKCFQYFTEIYERRDW
jgi:hypothetical protein